MVRSVGTMIAPAITRATSGSTKGLPEASVKMPARTGSEQDECVPKVVNVGEADRGVFGGRLAQCPSDAIVRSRSGQTDDDRDDTDHRFGLVQALEHLPDEHGADRQEPERVAEIGGPEKSA